MQARPEPGRRGLVAIGREAIGRALAHGSAHAGNLAFLALVTLFPAAILLVSIAGVAGQTAAGQAALAGFLALLPPDSAAFLAPHVEEVLAGRSGQIVPLSVLVALWTVSGFVETLRAIVCKAHGRPLDRPLWQTRALSALVGLAGAVLALGSLAVDLLLRYGGTLLARLGLAALSGPFLKGVPLLIAFAVLALLYAALTPRDIPGRISWPGGLVVVLVWLVAANLIGPVLALTGGLARTYGALSGVMVALLFFWVLGFALVLGAEVNAELSKARGSRLDPRAKPGLEG
ncbi:YihY/virulence factor BrkB family protein [Thermaurantiacus sp.]